MDVVTLGRHGLGPRGACVKATAPERARRDVGDSTDYTEVWDVRIGYTNHKIPITSLVREEIETSYQQRKWQIGRSESAPPLRYLDRSLGEARLMDYGTGLKSRMLPEAMQKPLPGRRAGGAPHKAPAQTKSPLPKKSG
jgi:hypothetical protein